MKAHPPFWQITSLLFLSRHSRHAINEGLSIRNDTPRERSARFRSERLARRFQLNDWHRRPSVDRILRNGKPFTRQKVTDKTRNVISESGVLVSRARKTRRGAILTEPSRVERIPASRPERSSTAVEVASAGQTKWWRPQERTRTRYVPQTSSARTALNFVPGAIDNVIILLRLNFPRTIETRDACSIRARLKNSAWKCFIEKKKGYTNFIFW